MYDSIGVPALDHKILPTAALSFSRQTLTRQCALQDDTVIEVINTQANRMLLLCKGHVALVRSKSLALRSTYKSMWTVPVPEIKIVRGAPSAPALCLSLIDFSSNSR